VTPPGTAAGVLARAAALGEISEEPHRLTRRFGTPALTEAGELVAGWMEVAGMAVRRDAVGNVVGRYAGSADGPPLVVGSHLDTVPDAGRFDGALGILAGLAVVERLAAREERLPHPLEVVAFAEEEGVRFGTAFFGSAAYSGTFDADWLELVDDEGITAAEAIRASGGDPAALVSLEAPRLAGYLEVHIEQGPVLERAGLPVGVVTAIAGQTRAILTLLGRAGHAGTLPMTGRMDALVAAAEVVIEVERIGRGTGGLVATVGWLDVEPRAANVVPGTATLSVDVRHAEDSVRERAVDAVRDAVERIAVERGAESHWRIVQETPAVPMAADLQDRFADALAAESLAVRRLVSGAGHDAAILARICPAGMLFVRCAGGVSHDPGESVDEKDVAVAVDVLERVVRAS
jgi:allantoate deiminase